MSHQIILDEWIARCAARISTLLPQLGAATAGERARQMVRDAYRHEPEIAAEVYARELGPHDVAWDPDLPGDWSVTFELEEGTDEEIRRAVAAAETVLKAHGVPAFAGTNARFCLESWDDSGFADKYLLTPEENADLEVWADAGAAADATLDLGGTRAQRWGCLGAASPSTMRFEEAHRRWRAGRADGLDEPSTQARAVWLDRFAAQLGKLQPSITPPVAWQHAEATFSGAADLAPEEAAEIFVLEEPPGDSGAPE